MGTKGPVERAARAIETHLRTFASEKAATSAARFFRSGPGEYGEGDVFLGVRVPDVRRVARTLRETDIATLACLLESTWHEVRLLALIVLGERYVRASEKQQAEIYNLYLARKERINNWDLVDTSAPHIVGRHLLTRSRAPLYRLARSKLLWDRRIAIIATQHFIRQGDVDETYKLATVLLHDTHDLLHKAVGWMLREAGQRQATSLEEFLDAHAAAMPRTMLRYALEKVPEAKRRMYMHAKSP